MLWNTPPLIAHSQLLIQSLRHWTGRDLFPGVTDPREQARLLFHAPFVLVSHGTQPDPILNYGNAAALALWDISWEDFTRMPSRLTAEAPNREERARLLERVTRDGFIANYAGIRIGKTGRRFRIAQATVWNLIAPPAPERLGQAAMFDTWTFLDSPATS